MENEQLGLGATLKTGMYGTPCSCAGCPTGSIIGMMPGAIGIVPAATGAVAGALAPQLARRAVTRRLRG